MWLLRCWCFHWRVEKWMSLLRVSSRSSFLSCIISTFACGLQLDFFTTAFLSDHFGRPAGPSLRQMLLSRGPRRRRRKELAVSQVLLILIGSGMTYCQGEGDCHGPTGMGAGGGMQGCRRHLCVCHWCASLFCGFNKITTGLTPLQWRSSVCQMFPTSEISYIVVEIFRTFDVQPVHIIPFGDFIGSYKICDYVSLKCIPITYTALLYVP